MGGLKEGIDGMLRIQRLRFAATLGVGLILGSAALAQTGAPPRERYGPDAGPVEERPQAEPERVDPRVVTINRMMRPITVSFEGNSLRQVLEYIGEITQANLFPQYIDDRRGTGLDPDAEVELDVQDVTAINLLERVLDHVTVDDFDAPTWQLTSDGRLEIGPRSLLNRRQVLKAYYVHDLVFRIPDFANAPELDLNNVLGGGGGGGGGGDSPFEENDDEDGNEIGGMALNEDLIEELLDVIRLAIEPDQWRSNGGDGATISFFRGTMLIRAPSYIHRQVGGWDWMPSGYDAFYNRDRQRARLNAVRNERSGSGGDSGGSSAGGDGSDGESN